jgi:hypothetical protein
MREIIKIPRSTLKPMTRMAAMILKKLKEIPIPPIIPSIIISPPLTTGTMAQTTLYWPAENEDEEGQDDQRRKKDIT